jgi:type I restriction enzyme M protein
MPLFYMLLAHHEGLLGHLTSDDINVLLSQNQIPSVENDANDEADILKRLKEYVNNDYYKGETAKVVLTFYSKCYNYINEFYSEIIEYIIDFISSRLGKISSMYATPKEISKLMVKLVVEMDPKKVYDPCAGLCTFFMSEELQDCNEHGQELNLLTKLIADIRTDAYKYGSYCTNEDCTEHWESYEGCDTLLSDLPLGAHIISEKRIPHTVSTLEDFVISRFISSDSLNKAVLLISMGTCNRGDNMMLRQSLCNNNLVDMVISLPAGIIPQSGVSTAIIVLNKNKLDNRVQFVCADDCLCLESGNKKALDYEKVLSRLEINDQVSEMNKRERISIVPIESTKGFNYNLSPNIYMDDDIDILPGQVLTHFPDLATKIHGELKYSDTKGKELLSNKMNDSIINQHIDNIDTNADLVNRKTHLVKISERCVIFNMRADKFFIKKDEEPLFVSPNFFCFEVDESRCIPEYFAYVVTNAANYRNNAMVGASIQRVNFDLLYIPIYPSIESQENIIKRLYREEKDRLKKKMEELDILSGKASDLIHNLGVTFTKIGAGIGTLRTLDDNDIVEDINDNVKFALRQINSTGADYSCIEPSLDKVLLYDVVKSYVGAWNNFGFKTFEVLPVKCTMPEDTKVNIDVDLLYTMLDCIFINAHQHAFNKHKKPENTITVEIKGVIVNDEEYAMLSVSNNGNPLPDNFSLKDYISRGVVGINSCQDGLGGNHIYEITHKFGGKVSINNGSEWLSINILLPIYISSDNSIFEDYECECL